MATILANGGSSDKVMAVHEAAYLAGFVDGEGCLTIGRARKEESRAGVTYFAVMTVSSTDLDALMAVMAMCGNGKVQLQDKRSRPEHRTLYRILWSANQIRHLLPQLRPYLLIKGRQADVLSKFLATKVNGRNVTPENWQQWEVWRAEIRTLNKRGRASAPVAPDGALLPERLSVRGDKRSERPVRTCERVGCARVHYGKGFCWIHYRKFVLRGGPKVHAKQCVVCGSEFQAKRVDTECCSRKCIDKRYYAANAERIKAQVKANKARKKDTPT